MIEKQTQNINKDFDISFIVTAFFNKLAEDNFILDLSDVLKDILITNIDYDSNGNAIYVGKAKPSTLDTQPNWFIKKFEYDSNGNCIKIRFANGSPLFNSSWDSRTELEYT